MQLATPTAIATNRDKTSWPVTSALPTALPTPAAPTAAPYDMYARFSAGSFADSRTGRAVRTSPTYDLNEHVAPRAAARMLGTDPRAALAAAVAMAGADYVQSPDQLGRTPTVKTLVGLYRTDRGAYWAAPMWMTPGTNDWQNFYALGNSFAARPDARFTFRDDRLAAVVGIDGWIVSPAHAPAFGS